MLDRQNRVILEKNGATWPTEKIKRLFWSQDLNVVNLEGPVTSDKSVSINTIPGEKGHFSFTFDPENTKKFLDGNDITLVNLGNNHIGNFGMSGVAETENNLKSDGVDYFGQPASSKILVKNINNKKIAFINYNQFGGASREEVIKEIIESKKQADLSFVFCHWGNEYETNEDYQQVSLAHSFVDAGADLIIGSHPHVVEPMEVYKNRAIFYSLGNFYFDQYFSEDVRNMLTVGVVVHKDRMDFYLVPLRLGNNGQISLKKGNDLKLFLEKFANDSKFDGTQTGAIIKGELSLSFK
jgi:poly-gamma-glutamate synthesis protein (capsule biosynthesis protein)